MTPFDPADLDEAMNAIKEEIVKDLSESIILEKQAIDNSIERLEFS